MNEMQQCKGRTGRDIFFRLQSCRVEYMERKATAHWEAVTGEWLLAATPEELRCVADCIERKKPGAK